MSCFSLGIDRDRHTLSQSLVYVHAIRGYYSVVLGWCFYFFYYSIAHPLPENYEDSYARWDKLHVWIYANDELSVIVFLGHQLSASLSFHCLFSRFPVHRTRRQDRRIGQQNHRSHSTASRHVLARLVVEPTLRLRSDHLSVLAGLG